MPDEYSVEAPAKKAQKKSPQAPSQELGSCQCLPSDPTVQELKARLPANKRYRHAAASALHGWHEHEYHDGHPVRMPEPVYQCALEAACHRDPTTGKYVPHPPALSFQKKRRTLAAKSAREEAKKAKAERVQKLKAAREARRAK